MATRASWQAEKGLYVMPIGGLNFDTIGGNGTIVYYCPEDATASQITRVLVDLGVMLGYGGVTAFPDTSRFLRHRDTPQVQAPEEIQALFLTHSHIDHLGALGHMIRGGHILPPVYGTPFTLEVLRKELKAAGIRPWDWPQMNVCMPGDKIKIQDLTIEPISVSHSTPQSVAFLVESPKQGNDERGARVLLSGDLKGFDQSLLCGPVTDVARLQQIGREGIDALCLDSTRCKEDGHVPLESEVYEILRKSIVPHKGSVRVSIAGGNIDRLASLAKIAHESGRTIVLESKSLRSNLEAYHVAGESLRDKCGCDINIEYAGTVAADAIPANKRILIGCGANGMPNGAIKRWANDPDLQKNELIIQSDSALPFLIASTRATLNALEQRGCKIKAYDRGDKTHASGHGMLGDLKGLIRLLGKPFTVPFHGSYAHLARLAHAIREEFGEDKTTEMKNCYVMKVDKDKTPEIVSTRQAKWLEAGYRQAPTKMDGVPKRSEMNGRPRRRVANARPALQ